MHVALAQAYNGFHKNIARHLQKLGVDTSFFDIDSPNWQKGIPVADAYFWHADDKGRKYELVAKRTAELTKITSRPVFPNLSQNIFFNNKFLQHYFLKSNNLPIPKTFVTDQINQAQKYISHTAYPFVTKIYHSASGQGVFLIKNKIAALKYLKNSKIFYAQEFIPDQDRDLRIITVGEKIAAAYWRINPTNWLHNLNHGSTISNKNIPQTAKTLAIKISKKMNFPWMAYDFIIKNHKPLILEFSGNFGVLGATQLGIDIRAKQAEYIVKQLNKS
ncbi:hypothetical protein CL634_04380 [bacterium]|nr:hypothetical protein [bacterium]